MVTVDDKVYTCKYRECAPLAPMQLKVNRFVRRNKIELEVYNGS
jgi:hypothetical protein